MAELIATVQNNIILTDCKRKSCCFRECSAGKTEKENTKGEKQWQLKE